jgi:hypothetical protein
VVPRGKREGIQYRQRTSSRRARECRWQWSARNSHCLATVGRGRLYGQKWRLWLFRKRGLTRKSSQCLPWVISCREGRSRAQLLYPQLRTRMRKVFASALGQKRRQFSFNYLVDGRTPIIGGALSRRASGRLRFAYEGIARSNRSVAVFCSIYQVVDSGGWDTS